MYSTNKSKKKYKHKCSLAVGRVFVLFCFLLFWVHSVPISTRMTKWRKDPALLKLPWNSFDNRGTEHKLSHGDLSQTRCDASQSLASPVQRTREGSELCKGKCKQVKWEKKSLPVGLCFMTSHHTGLNICLFFFFVCVDTLGWTKPSQILLHQWDQRANRTTASPCICIVSCLAKARQLQREDQVTVTGQKQMEWNGPSVTQGKTPVLTPVFECQQMTDSMGINSMLCQFNELGHLAFLQCACACNTHKY